MGIQIEVEIDKQIKLSHLLLNDRKCRVCDELKNLVGEFYRTRKDRGPVASSYSYECKECAKKRVNERKKNKSSSIEYKYPDW